MKNTIIPAQITTVEDKIAGNLSLTQIMLLMLPVFWGIVLYAIIYPQMEISTTKIILAVIVFIISSVLAIRIKGKLIANWLIVILKFNLRPKYYLFDKNDSYLREVCLPIIPKSKKLVKISRVKVKTKCPQINSEIEEHKLNNLIKNQSISYKLNKGGAINVAFEQVRQ
jgi:hypothetical protein